MGSGEDGVFGPATAVFLKPDWSSSVTMGFSLIWGTLLSTKDFHRKVGRFGRIHLFAALLSLLVLFLIERKMKDGTRMDLRCSAIFVWLMIFGLIGLFRKFFQQ